MVSDVSSDDCVVNNENGVLDDGSQLDKKKRGKVPKRVLKAEREKLKREKLNDLFTKLGSLLELSEQNNGKACMINETIRLIKETISQIQSLRKENSTLLSESQYVTVERDELKDENSALELQIKGMQVELEEKIAQLNPRLPSINPLTQQPALMHPLYVIPINPDIQTFEKPDAGTIQHVPVSKPHPRYPTPTDSWPLHLLSKQTETPAES